MHGEKKYIKMRQTEKTQKNKKIKINTMKNTKAIVDASLSGVFEIKKYILLRSMKKINDIMRKTRRIRKMTAEFYGRIDDVPPLETNEEQERHAKKINDFQRGIGKRWGEIWLDKEEIYATIATLYELAEVRKKYPDIVEPENIPSWMDIRREIENRMKKILCQ